MHFHFSSVSCVLLLLSGALATYRHGGLDLHEITSQSYAQTRNIGRTPQRTLNPAIHGISDYRYRGYHYRQQPPWMPPPVSYRPVPLPSPPVTYQRHSLPMPHYHHPFKGPVPPQRYNIYKAPPPPLVHHYPMVKGPFPAAGHYKYKGTCHSPPMVRPDPTLATPPATVPTLPATAAVSQATVPPTLPMTFPPMTTFSPATTTVPVIETTMPPVEITTPVMLPVSNQSDTSTTVSPVETGLDPCAMGHDCDHICVNSNASYSCKCRNGYILNADKKTCSMKQVKAVVVEDPCKCEARLAFQKQTQTAIQQLTAKLSDVTGRVQQLEGMLGRA